MGRGPAGADRGERNGTPLSPAHAVTIRLPTPMRPRRAGERQGPEPHGLGGRRELDRLSEASPPGPGRRGPGDRADAVALDIAPARILLADLRPDRLERVLLAACEAQPLDYGPALRPRGIGRRAFERSRWWPSSCAGDPPPCGTRVLSGGPAEGRTGRPSARVDRAPHDGTFESLRRALSEAKAGGRRRSKLAATGSAGAHGSSLGAGAVGARLLSAFLNVALHELLGVLLEDLVDLVQDVVQVVLQVGRGGWARRLGRLDVVGRLLVVVGPPPLLCLDRHVSLLSEGFGTPDGRRNDPK